MTRRKLYLALLLYALLALAGLPIREPSFRLALWVLLGGLAVKSVIAYYRSRYTNGI